MSSIRAPEPDELYYTGFFLNARGKCGGETSDDRYWDSEFPKLIKEFKKIAGMTDHKSRYVLLETARHGFGLKADDWLLRSNALGCAAVECESASTAL